MKDAGVSLGVKAEAGPWTALDELKIEFADEGNPASGRIYKNGLQQIAVLLTVKPTDASGNLLTEMSYPGITRRVRSALGLVNDADAHRLEFVPTAGIGSRWCYTSSCNEFSTGSSMNAAFSSGQPDDGDDGPLKFLFYVMCPPAEPLASIAIAAQIDVPNANGNGSHSVTTRHVQPGDLPKATVSIAALAPVRYTEANTALTSLLAYQDQGNSASRKMLAHNYAFACREPGHQFTRFDIAAASIGEYWHVFEETTAFQNPGESFRRYRKFNIAYAWSQSSPAQAQVFGMREQSGEAQHWWPVSVNQDRHSLYFTVAEYDSTQVAGQGFGYPGSPVNAVAAATNAGKAGVYFTAWDQYGNSADFTPATSRLLESFTVHPGRS